jgi:phenylalanyl-tRNA synthetase beta chain
MNILIPQTWLLEHLDTQADPQTIQEKLSLCGPSVEQIYEKEGESVYDIEVTTNRADSMSVRGIAREAAVILNQFGIMAQLKTPAYDQSSLEPDLSEDQHLALPQIQNDPELCERVMAIVLKNANRTPTPEWMAKRLRQIDVNVHDSVIDITNYITHEVGHPVHAFDYDKLMTLGGKIIIKEADAGKKFTTLDGISYTTVGGEVVFENDQGEIIDLPSIKGTANSSIDESTKNVLLLIDSIKAEKVRFASMTHQIRTVAAQLKEKNVDPHLGLPTLKYGVQLYRQLCGAQVASQLYDDFPGDFKLETVKLPLNRVEEYLGIKIPENQILDILKALDCQVQSSGDVLEVLPPSFRPDLLIPADLIEEIARIYGYHNLPSTLMLGEIPVNRPTHTDFVLENKIQRYLAAIGWQEVYSFSIVSNKLALASGLAMEEHLALQNPLTEDHVYLRRSLLPSLKQILDSASDQKQNSIFELANSYTPTSNNLPKEEMTLGMLSNKSYRQVRGDLEALLRQFFVTQIEVVPENHDDGTQSGKIMVVQDDQKITMGQISINNDNQVGCQINLSSLIQVARTHPTYRSIPTTAPIVEDLTFTFEAKTPVGSVLKTIKNQDSLITSVDLTAEYGQNFSFKITYQSQDKNLSTEDVRPIREKIVEVISQDYRAKLVGSLQ